MKVRKGLGDQSGGKRYGVKSLQAVEKGSPASLRSIASLQRIGKYASARRFSRASPLSLFEQPAIRVF